MCIGCYTLSVLTFFSPVSEAPQPANISALNQPANVPAQIQTELTPADVRAAIAAMLQHFPNTPNAQLLRDAFSQMQEQLTGVNDRGQVYQIVNENMLELSAQMQAAPNSVELLQLLQEAKQATPKPQASNLLQTQWGWLSSHCDRTYRGLNSSAHYSF